jgi:hypothetical protein
VVDLASWDVMWMEPWWAEAIHLAMLNPKPHPSTTLL